MPAVSLSPLFNGYQGFTPGGLPLTLGTIATYQAGTSTPLATYTTSSGSVANSNPILLGADGRPPQEIWLIQANAYKFVLSDALGSQIATYDNIVAPEAGLSNFITSLASATGSSLVGYKGGGTGAVTRTEQDKLRDTVSVIDYGGVMNNSTSGIRTSNAAALVAAIATGAKVMIPAGLFWIAPTVIANISYHVSGEGSALTTIKGDGNLITASIPSDGECQLFENIKLMNDATPGKLFTSSGTCNSVRFQNVNFQGGNYHIYSSGGDAVGWVLHNCRFNGAIIESRHFEGLWVYNEVGCYTWYCQVGLRCTNGNVNSCSIYGSVFEQMYGSAIILDASTASVAINAFSISGTHFEANGSATNASDVVVQTSAATQVRDVSFNSCGFLSPTVTQTNRVQVTWGGGGNVFYVSFNDCYVGGSVVLVNNITGVYERNIGRQTGSPQALTALPVQIPQSYSGGILGTVFTTGTNGGNSMVQCQVTPPGNAKMAVVVAQGNFLAAAGNTNTGYLVGYWFLSGNRTPVQTNTVGNGGGWVLSWTGTQIQVANATGLAQNQSCDTEMIFYG